MRRADRAVTDPDTIEAILQANAVCRLALHDTPFPYIVPLNYGMERDGDRFLLYFHCAREGRKLDLLRANPHAAFEVDGAHRLTGEGATACRYSYAYESVIGEGVLTEVSGSEKAVGLAALMRRLVPGETFTFDRAALEAVAVLRLDVRHITGKRNIKETP